MRIDNTISYNRSISTNQNQFTAVAKGKVYTYAQTNNQVFRLAFANNTIMDLI